jgi:hypothetical protein
MSPQPIRAAVDRALCLGLFFVALPRRLRIEHVASQQIPWDVFRGHLLAPNLARETATFEAWDVYLDSGDSLASAALISIKWQTERGLIYIARQILTHGFEAYEDSPGMILSRPIQKWVMELVGTVQVGNCQDDALAAELERTVFLAVVGTSRLPITSLESPLPDFLLGELAYLPEASHVPAGRSPHADPIAILQAALVGDRPLEVVARTLEAALRATPTDGLAALVDVLHRNVGGQPGSGERLAALLRAVFNGAALSPYTEFVDRLVEVVSQLAASDRWGAAKSVELFGFMLRQLCRHLTAFDLTLFHNLGANYPDALFLDALLKAFLRLVDQQSKLMLAGDGDSDFAARQKKRRRRALRQACLLRRQCEGLRVPDAPTSVGENARVLPAPFARVPEEQIVQMSARRRVLFEGDPLTGVLNVTGRRMLDESLADLDEPLELAELGTAVFLDRPLGVAKQLGEIDRTPLVSCEAFSRSIVKRRLAQLKSAGWLCAEAHQRHLAATGALSIPGVPAGQVSAVERPGVVSLADAHKVALDFVFTRTTRRSLDELLEAYELSVLAAAFPDVAGWLMGGDAVILLHDLPPGRPVAEATLKFFDQRAGLRLELGFGVEPGRMVRYVEQGGVEFADRLQVLSIGQPAEDGFWSARDVRGQSLWLVLGPRGKISRSISEH